MEPKPKERIVFDEDSYYGDEGAEWAVNDLMERKGLTEDEVRESFTDDEVFQHAMKLRDFDYEEEMRGLPPSSMGRSQTCRISSTLTAATTFLWLAA